MIDYRENHKEIKLDYLPTLTSFDHFIFYKTKFPKKVKDTTINHEIPLRNSLLCQKLLRKSLKTNLAKITASLLSTL